MKKNGVAKIAALALSCACAATTIAAPAQAKSVSAATTWKKAKKVKTGTTTVKIPTQGSFAKGFVKFTAPKAGTYAFAIGGLKKVPNDPDAIECGYASVQTAKSPGRTPTTVKVKTKGGKTYALNLCTKKFREVDLRGGKKTVSAQTYLTKRSFSLKMKKNQTVWLYFSFTGKQANAVVKIAKK